MRELVQGAPGAFALAFSEGFTKKYKELAQEAREQFPFIFNTDSIRKQQKNLTRKLKEHLPLTFNKDLIKRCEGKGPRSSEDIFHYYNSIFNKKTCKR